MAGKSLVSSSDFKLWSQVLIASSVVAIALAALGYLGTDIWLASTQWLLVAAVLAGLGVYARLEAK